MPRKTERSDIKERQKILYSAIVDAYIQSSMERDRSLLNLSAGAIGLIVTLMTTVGVTSTCELFLYVTANLVFGATIILILHVFKLNKIYLLNLANDNPADDNKLKKYGNSIFVLFIYG